jgi:hypothetical protein
VKSVEVFESARSWFREWDNRREPIGLMENLRSLLGWRDCTTQVILLKIPVRYSETICLVAWSNVRCVLFTCPMFRLRRWSRLHENSDRWFCNQSCGSSHRAWRPCRKDHLYQPRMSYLLFLSYQSLPCSHPYVHREFMSL